MKIKELQKFAWENKLYLIPGYGPYKEFAKSKNERTNKGIFGWGAYGLWWGVRLAYVCIGLDTGNWAPNNFLEYFENKEEIVFEKQNKNNLEKTLEVKELN